MDRPRSRAIFCRSGWNGIGGPRNLPADIVNKLNTAVNAALADPKLKARFADLGQERFSVTPTDFGNFMSAETEKWGKVIRAANIKAE